MARKETITAREYSYVVLFQPEPEGGYTVTCPTLPGLVSHGETLGEARTMAAEAIEAYLESLQKNGETVPESDLTEQPGKREEAEKLEALRRDIQAGRSSGPVRPFDAADLRRRVRAVATRA